MSGNFYTVLLFSLLLTVGAFLIYYGYRYFLALYGGKKTPNKYVTVHNLENGEASSGGGCVTRFGGSTRVSPLP